MFDLNLYLVLLLFLGGLVVLKQIQKQPENAPLQQMIAKQYGTITSLVDTMFNTWTFRVGNSGFLEYSWRSLGGEAKILWDSNVGVCSYLENFTSMTNDPYITLLDTSVVLGQTPMYIDPLGIQRTFQLKLYSGDVRIESTNGERAHNLLLGAPPVPRFWSIFQRDITSATDYNLQPTGWPTTESDLNWQSIGPNGSVVAQFLNSGDLILHPSFLSQNSFQASTFFQPIC